MAPRRRASRPDTRSGRRGDAGQGRRRGARPAAPGAARRAGGGPAPGRRRRARRRGPSSPGRRRAARAGRTKVTEKAPITRPAMRRGTCTRRADPVPGELGVGAEAARRRERVSWICTTSPVRRTCSVDPPGRTGAAAQEPGMVEQDQALRRAAARDQVAPGGVLREHDPPVPPVEGRHGPADDLGQEDDDRRPARPPSRACMVRAASCRARRRALRWLAAARAACSSRSSAWALARRRCWVRSR